MAERTCHNCVYCCYDPGLWLRLLWAGAPILPRCANHPQWPGQLHDVPGVPCRNYRPRPATPAGDVRMIALGDGCYAYVDAADHEWLRQWKWHLCNGYAGRSEKGKIILMHRQILQPPDGMLVDHIDGNKANNCRINLRVCTRAQNMRNKRKHSGSSSRFKCVFYDKRTGKWYARCRYQGKNRVLGYFDDEVEAARAYDRKAVEWFGEFARLNFPEEWPPQRRAEVYAQRQEPSDEGKRRKAKGKRKKGKGKDATARLRRPSAATKSVKPRRAQRVRRGKKTKEDRH